MPPNFDFGDPDYGFVLVDNLLGVACLGRAKFVPGTLSKPSSFAN
jgi:hypothetical protein